MYAILYNVKNKIYNHSLIIYPNFTIKTFDQRSTYKRNTHDERLRSTFIVHYIQDLLKRYRDTVLSFHSLDGVLKKRLRLDLDKTILNIKSN